jgi:hypothetical protein
MRKLALGLSIAVLFCSGSQAGFFEDVFRGASPAGQTADVLGRAVQDIKQAQPPNIQPELERIYTELAQRSDEDLYFLKAATDVCGFKARLDCKIAPSAAVKPIVEVSLERRKAAVTRKDTDQSFLISAGGFLVSILSLCVSAGSFLRTTKKTKKR